MKVLLINGSPREKGCTFTALSEVAAALEQNEIETELLSIGREPIRGCIACGGCSDGRNRCVFDQDCVNRFLEKAQTADGFVIGSPVYFASASGALVSALDRMFYAGKGLVAYKPGAAVVSARRAGTTASLDQINKYFTISNMPIVSSRYWNMVHGSTPEQVRQDLEGLQVMRTLGHNMAWLLKCIQAGKAAGAEPLMKEMPVRTDFIR